MRNTQRWSDRENRGLSGLVVGHNLVEKEQAYSMRMTRQPNSNSVLLKGHSEWAWPKDDGESRPTAS